MKRLRWKQGSTLALRRRLVAAVWSVVLVELCDACAMKSYESPNALRKVLAAPAMPGLWLAGHLHIWSFEAMFAVAGGINVLLYAMLFNLLLRRRWPHGI